MVTSGNKITRMDNRNAVRKAKKQIRRETVIKSNCRKSDRNIANRKSEFLTGEGVMEDIYFPDDLEKMMNDGIIKCSCGEHELRKE